MTVYHSALISPLKTEQSDEKTSEVVCAASVVGVSFPPQGDVRTMCPPEQGEWEWEKIGTQW